MRTLTVSSWSGLMRLWLSMSDFDFTPTTKVVRHIYVHGGYDLGLHQTTKEGAEDFERWLAQHDKELRESIAQEVDAFLEQMIREGRIDVYGIRWLQNAVTVVRGES